MRFLLLLLLCACTPAGAGAGPPLVAPASLSLGADGALVVVDPGAGAVFRVDPRSGDRAVLYGPDRGDAEAPSDAVALSDGSLLVLEEDLDAVFQVSASGERTLVSRLGLRGEGPGLERPSQLARLRGGTLVVSDREDERLLTVDPASGDRREVPGSAALMGGILAVGDRLLAAELLGEGLVEVDPATGDRRRLVDLRRDGRPFLELARGLGAGASGEVLVACLGTGRVMAVDPESGRRRLLSSPEAGSGTMLPQARDAVALPDGSVACTWPAAGAVVRLEASGRRSVLSGPALPEGLLAAVPAGLQVSPAGRVLAVDLLSGSVVDVDPDSGRLQTVSGAGRGGGPPLSFPIALGLFDEATALVVDRVAGLLQVDLASGDRTRLQEEAVRALALEDPCVLVRTGDGGVLLTDGFSARLVRLLPAVEVLGGEGEEMVSAEGAAVLEDGRLAVADGSRGTVLAVDLATGRRTLLGKGFQDPWGLAAAPGGRLYVANAFDGSVERVDPREVVSRRPPGELSGELTQMAWHPSGRLLVCNPGGVGLLVVEADTGRRRLLRLSRP